MSWCLPLGARPANDGVEFRVWAPDHDDVVVVEYVDGVPAATYPLVADPAGYWSGHVAGLEAGSQYMYRLGGELDRPDPASRHQPTSVHGPSMVVDPAFPWTDDRWTGLPREALVIYELHVGTATDAGTFEALIARLPYLRELGITALELMPVADFPGDRNWGYDGVDLYAPARAYGGTVGLKLLVDAAHAHGLAVLLDVVYNHLGPAGNYLRDYSRQYFTGRHHTPWGEAINFDGSAKQAVRDFFMDNALYWVHEYHIDGLRLDATHAIIDDSPVHLLQELAERVRASLPAGRQVVLIAEDERNEARLSQPVAQGGIGLDGLWADDFHHVVRVCLTGEQEGYFGDYQGGTAELVTVLRDGWLYQGQPSLLAGHPRGTPAYDLAPAAFVHCIQNHDQIGNRALGERLNHDVSLPAYLAASVLLLLSPYTPLLFMGQEWAASTPFLFFTDHDAELGKAVTEGRRREFAYFAKFTGAEVPDPQALTTFERSRLDWSERTAEPHAGVLRIYRDLLDLRRRVPAASYGDRSGFEVRGAGNAGVALLRRAPATADQALLVIVNLRGSAEFDLTDLVASAQDWCLALDSLDARYGGVTPDELAPPPVLSDQVPHIKLDGPRALAFVGIGQG